MSHSTRAGWQTPGAISPMLACKYEGAQVTTDAYPVTGVAGGALDSRGEAALLAFDGETGPLNVVLPVGELAALLSVCVGLTSQALPQAGEVDHVTIPVGDWRVGVTASHAVAVAFAPASGGALSFHLTRAQAEALAGALTRAVAAAAPEDALSARCRH